MEQSRGSKLPHGPGETPADDGLPYSEIGETVIKQQGPKGDHGPVVPKLNFNSTGSQGGVQEADFSGSAPERQEPRGGKAGYVNRSDADWGDSTVEQFASNRGDNS